MSFQITKGLFLLDFVDHHAVLGLPIGAEAAEVRKRYLKIARRLHPDSFAGAEQASDKDQATQILSKLVNPAYENLFQERNRKEYLLVVGLKGQQARQQSKQFTLAQFCDPAKRLAKTPLGALEHEYKTAVKALANNQFENLSQTLEHISHLSELNLVYLVRREGPVAKPAAPPPATGATVPANPTGATVVQPTPAPKPMPDSGERTVVQSAASQASIVDGYLNRAQGYMGKKAFDRAVLELRDAVRAAPNDSRCHSMMGLVYLQQNKPGMARVSIKRALELNPQDPKALEGKRALEKMGHKLDTATTQGTTNKSQAAQKTTPQKTGDRSTKPTDKGGGLFGGLFGGKKK